MSLYCRCVLSAWVVRGVTITLVLTACWQVPGALRAAYDDARNGASRSREARELAPGESVGLEHLNVFPRLAALMPDRSTYAVELSHDAGPAELRGWGSSFANYWLLPRRNVSDAARPDFYIVFGSVPQYVRAAAIGVRVVGGDVHLVRLSR